MGPITYYIFPEAKHVFYLIRHGSTDYSQRNTKFYQGFGVNLSPLSVKGTEEIRQTAKDSRLAGTSLILSSPYTRALQTAAILSKELQAEIVIETDLHEWLANKSYIYEPDENAENSYHEFVSMGGNYADGREKDWEDLTAMRKRVLRVLEKYSSYDKVAVACHGMIIQSVCHGYHPANGEIVELNPDIFR